MPNFDDLKTIEGESHDPEPMPEMSEPPIPNEPPTIDLTTSEIVENTALMTIEEASKITNSTGKNLLIDLKTSQLGFMATALGNKPGLTPAEETELLAIQVITKARIDGQQAGVQERMI
jgi:hypothetical protein